MTADTITIEVTAETVIEIISDVTGVETDAIGRRTIFFRDIIMDSLDMMEILMQVEDSLDVHVPEEDLEGKTSVGDLIDYVIKHRQT